MFLWNWLVGRVGQALAGAIGVGLIMALLTGAGALVVSWIRAGNNAEWLKEINRSSAVAVAQEKARSEASEKAAQAERERAEVDRADALDRVRSLEFELQALKDDPICFPRSIARSLRK